MEMWWSEGKYKLPDGRTFILLSVDCDRRIARLMWTHSEHIGGRHEDVPLDGIEKAEMVKKFRSIPRGTGEG
jgi:hypothetical protein